MSTKRKMFDDPPSSPSNRASSTKPAPSMNAYSWASLSTPADLASSPSSSNSFKFNPSTDLAANHLSSSNGSVSSHNLAAKLPAASLAASTNPISSNNHVLSTNVASFFNLASSAFPGNLSNSANLMSSTKVASSAQLVNKLASEASLLSIDKTSSPTLVSCANRASPNNRTSFAEVLSRNATRPKLHTTDIIASLLFTRGSQFKGDLNGLRNTVSPEMISTSRLIGGDFSLPKLHKNAVPLAQFPHKRVQKMHAIQSLKRNECAFSSQKLEDSLVPFDAKKDHLDAFPMKLYQILSHLREIGRTDVASFLPNGRAFVIYKPDIFIRDVVPKYYQMSSFASFRRQLNMYGFELITTGPDKGAYFHDLFVNGKPHLNRRIKRKKDKRASQRTKGGSNP